MESAFVFKGLAKVRWQGRGGVVAGGRTLVKSWLLEEGRWEPALAAERLARGGNAPAPRAFFRSDLEREGFKPDPLHYQLGCSVLPVPRALCRAVPVPPVAVLLGTGVQGAERRRMANSATLARGFC